MRWKPELRELPAGGDYESIFTFPVELILWFPTHFTKNVKWVGHGAFLHHP